MKRSPTTFLTALAAALAAVAAGCGGDSDGGQSSSSRDPERPNLAVQGGETVPATDIADVLRAQNAVRTKCGLVENMPGGDLPLEQAIATLHRVYRQDPKGIFAAGVSTRPRNMEAVVRENADTLRGCGQMAAADKLASVLPTKT